jgi:hypothetical protein
MFDPLTAFSVASAFALLTGGVFGFAYSALPAELHRSARDWQVGTLMMGAALVLFAAVNVFESGWARWCGNVLWFFATAFYWRSIRRYFNWPENHLVFFAAGAGAFASLLFMALLPNFAMRVAIATICGSIGLIGAAYTLFQNRKTDHSYVGWVMIVLFVSTTSLLVARSLYYLKVDARAGVMLGSKSFVISITPILLSALPVIGTTAFVLMCLERAGRQSHRSQG